MGGKEQWLTQFSMCFSLWPGVQMTDVSDIAALLAGKLKCSSRYTFKKIVQNSHKVYYSLWTPFIFTMIMIHLPNCNKPENLCLPSTRKVIVTNLKFYNQ